MRIIAFLFLTPLLAHAYTAEEYQQYFANGARADQAAECRRVEAEAYGNALEMISREARRYGAAVEGRLTKPEHTECRRLVPYYATLSNGMRCYYNPFNPSARQSSVYCR